MTSMPSFREIENLSAYLDGQLSQVACARLESRLASDPHLRATLEELRQTRALLRRTPQRRAPRSFVLTPEMAGIRPPMPRLVPVFRYASAVSILLLILTFAANYVAPLAMSRPAPIYGIGGGVAEAEPTLASVLVEPPSAAESTATPQPTAALASQAIPGMDTATQKQPTPIPPQEPSAERTTIEQPEEVLITQESTRPGQLISTTWQVVLVGLAVFSAGLALTIRLLNEWAFRRKSPRTPSKK